MKPILLVLLILLSVGLLQAQTTFPQPDCKGNFNLSAVGTSLIIPNSGTGCIQWLVTYHTSGFTSVVGEFDYASDKAVNQAGPLAIWPGTAAMTNTGDGMLLTGIGFHPWAAVRLTASTGTGSFTGTFWGWREPLNLPSGVGISSAPAITPVSQYGAWNANLVLKDALGREIKATPNGLPVSPPPLANKCATEITEATAFTQTATTKVLSNSSQPSMRFLICYVRLVAAAAEITSELEGSGTNCGTGAIAHSGSTTAANGESFAANGGYSGNFSPYATLPGNDWCVGQSGSNRVSGTVHWIRIPATTNP